MASTPSIAANAGAPPDLSSAPSKSPRSSARKHLPVLDDPMIMNAASCHPGKLPCAFFGEDRMVWGEDSDTLKLSMESALAKVKKILGPAHYHLMHIQTGQKKLFDKLVYAF